MTKSVFSGPVYVVRDNIDTDQIISAQYLNLVPTIAEEYEKLGSGARALPHVFLYITDDGPMSPSDIAALPRLCLVISADMHPGLMGRMCAFLRQQTWMRGVSLCVE